MSYLLGTSPNQVPTNGDLGSMAFEDRVNYAPSLTVLTNGSTAIGFDGSRCAIKLTPTALATLTTTVPPAGTICNLIILTAGTSSYTLTFGTGFKATGTLATGTVDAKTFVMSFISDGTNVIETARTVAM